ncbi:hypothetical protein P43SY_008631 [Pythium insidiosum]|uniref:GPI ethanolamine phosphate transferase 1 n=1 Tax=Pythium insidiosum TaxID=114742 RepID=A0AAD5M741_PYTIN|nr:hypothetical protein P43SY_008631 [Pythium insidiosum]
MKMSRSHPPGSSASSLRSLLVLGVVFHAIYVLSIFDIYFTSPVVPHVESLAYASSASSSSAPSWRRPPAKRVVVFVADGCRADKFFERNASTSSSSATTPRVAFLRDVIAQRGAWGVSHTRVPTESRPGHVALFAGMYEDVSAVTKGWQDNPVDFDSVFNQSRHAWLFGSPDIVPMFARRVPQATARFYSHEDEDFAAQDASQLDVWVLERLRALLLTEAPANATLDAQLRRADGGVVIFCHFLGIDTNGHAHRPASRDYLHNIALVDELVEKIHAMVEDFYDHDGATAYVFTADHGMSNKGAHGDGDPANTRTPLVAWGAGIAPPATASSAQGFTLDLPTQSRAHVEAQLAAQPAQEAAALRDWGLAHLVRRDVMQADVAPLLSALLGLPYPRNSVGVLPFTFLRRGAYRTHAVLSNAQQLRLHAQRKASEKQARTLVGFRPYAPFRDDVPRLQREMERAWRACDLSDARDPQLAAVERLAQQLIAISLDTLEYFQRYDWFFLLGVIVLGYVGWMLLLAVAYVSAASFSLRASVLAPCRDVRFALLALVAALFLLLEHSPWSYLVYVAFGLVFWRAALHHRALLLAAAARLRADAGSRRQLLAITLSLELVAVGYHRRWIFSAVFALLALWPVAAGRRSPLVPRWVAACLALAVFPCLPTEYGDHTLLVELGGGVLALLLAAVATRSGARSVRLLPLLLPLALALGTLHWTMQALAAKRKPALALTLANWALALLPITALAVRVRTSRSPPPPPLQRLVAVAAALAPPYVLLSISYEVLFYAALCAVLLCWVALETRQQDGARDGDGDAGAVRRAFFFLVLVKIAFFGTGNVASMSSFEISSTYRFVTVFSPFLMGALLVVKILIPFLVVAVAFHALVSSASASHSPSPARYFLLVVGMSDVLALQFLFLVRNEGSWKEIGNSISMFGIVNAQIVFVPLLFLLASALAPPPRAATATASIATAAGAAAVDLEQRKRV